MMRARGKSLVRRLPAFLAGCEPGIREEEEGRGGRRASKPQFQKRAPALTPLPTYLPAPDPPDMDERKAALIDALAAKCGALLELATAEAGAGAEGGATAGDAVAPAPAAAAPSSAAAFESAFKELRKWVDTAADDKVGLPGWGPSCATARAAFVAPGAPRAPRLASCPCRCPPGVPIAVPPFLSLPPTTAAACTAACQA